MSGERILRSKGSASQPSKIVTLGVVVDRRDFDDVLGRLSSPKNEIELESFIENLSESSSLKDQIKHIQQFRGLFLKSVSSLSSSINIILGVRLLTKIYLHPDYALLRKSVEWIIDVVCTNRSNRQRALQEALCSMCMNLVGTAEILGVSKYMNIEAATAWALSFTCIAMFDKEYHFLDEYVDSPVEDTKMVQLNDASPLLSFLLVLGAMFEKFSKIVSAKEADSSAAVMRYAECCGECMRAIMTSLKSRKDVYVGEIYSEKWMALINSVIANGCAILQSDLVHKDTVTATAMSVMCLQWIARYRLRGGNTTDVVCDTTSRSQLLSILHLLDLSSSSVEVVPALQEISLAGVHSDLVANLPTLPIISRCAILRACLTVFDDFASFLESPSDSTGLSSAVSGSILLGPLFLAVVAVCNHSLPLVRLYGLQTLESWFNCLDLTITSSSYVGSINSLIPHLRVLSTLLINAWSHPSKQVNHMVPTVYQRLLNAAQKLTVGLRSAGRETEVTAVWKPFIAEALALPAQHRARYQAMTMLIPCVGGKQIIAAQPDVFEALVQAVRLRDVASSSCTVVVALLKDLIQHCEPTSEADISKKAGDLMEPLRPLWALSVASVMCSRDLKTRTNSADYLVPELLKIDPTSGPYLMEVIRSIHSSKKDGSYGAMLWGLVQVSLHARSMTLPGKDIICHSDLSGMQEGSGTMLTDREITWACLSEDVDLRLASLTLLTASQRTSAPMVESEIKILKSTLKYSLKTTGADQRQRLIRIVKAMVVRLSETSRINERDIQRLEKRSTALLRDKKVAQDQQSLEKVPELEGKLIEGYRDIDNAKVVIENVMGLLRWLCEELFDNMYPGTVFEREVTALELLHCAIDSTCDNVAMRNIFFSPSMTTTMLNLLLSSWDKSRRLAADLLFKFPRPLPCYTTSKDLIPLVDRGCKLAGSARQRESDAGALLLRNIFTIYSLSLGWHCTTITAPSAALTLSYSVEATSSAVLSVDDASLACASFIRSLCDLLRDRLGRLEGLFKSFNEGTGDVPIGGSGNEDNDRVDSDSDNTQAPEPLCHGLMLALRYCLKELHSSDLLGGTSHKGTKHPLIAVIVRTVWRPLVNRVLTLSLDALRVAMLVVAEAPCDVQFAPAPTARMRGEYTLQEGVPSDETAQVGIKGPVKSSTILTASYINTNSLMGATAGGSDGQSDGDKEAIMQRAVVGAWLLVKEAAAMLALLVEISPPPPPSNENSNTSLELLSIDDISNVGDVILDALGRLKHMGAIAETHSALQTIAERLFKHGERSVELCRLPSMWLRQLLDRLSSEQQVFILRRSAGFAYSFVSLLRSEPSNCKVTLLPLAMKCLLKHIEMGLDEAPLNEGQEQNNLIPVSDGNELNAIVDSECITGSWRICVHALNVIRMILIDAALSPDLDGFIAESTKLAVRGFQSRHWAVRNSSMMVFSSVVQRAVDNDKNESGGARAATASEFFQRFPSLFFFLLNELGNITGHKIICKNGWPESVAQGIYLSEKQETNRGSHEGGLHPSLYPILLLLSKMRPAAEEVQLTVSPFHSETAERSSNEQDSKCEFSRQADISLFVSLVESCRGQASQKVREMAAKALCPLIPLRAVPLKAAALLLDLNESLDIQSSNKVALKISHNELHGTLSLCYEVLDSLKRRLAGVGDNKVFLSLLQEEISRVLLPQLARMLSLLSAVMCPSLHIVFLRILRTILTLLSNYDDTSSSDTALNIAQSLLLGECRVVLRPILHCVNSGRDEENILPYEPVLYREAGLDLTFLSLQGYNGNYPLTTQVEEDESNSPFSIYPVFPLLSLLSHSMSEVREGILLGCLKAVSLTLSTTAASSNESHAVKQLLQSTGLFEVLLHRAAKELEPPLRSLTLQLLCSLTRLGPLSALGGSMIATFLRNWSLLHLIASSESIDRRLLESLELKASTTSAISEPEEEIEVTLASTESAAQALEIMGWVLAVSLERATTEDDKVVSTARTLGAEWVHLLEEGACEDRSAAAREAAARSLAASQLLPWSIAQTISEKRCQADDWAVLSVRVWLIALRLMQDDDEEIRAVASSAVAAVSYTELPFSSAQQYTPMPSTFSVVQGCMLERMGRLIAQVVVWSLSVSRNRLDAKADHYLEEAGGLVAVLDEFSGLIGSKEKVGAALQADGETVYDKIFEAEQANLHAEPLVAAQVLSDAIACICLLLSTSARAESLWIRSHMLQHSTDALSLIMDGNGGADWVGGSTYLKEIFVYLYGALQASATIEGQMKNNMVLTDICDESHLLLIQKSQQMIEEGSTHPWVRKSFEKLRLLLI